MCFCQEYGCGVCVEHVAALDVTICVGCDEQHRGGAGRDVVLDAPQLLLKVVRIPARSSGAVRGSSQGQPTVTKCPGSKECQGFTRLSVKLLPNMTVNRNTLAALCTSLPTAFPESTPTSTDNLDAHRIWEMMVRPFLLLVRWLS